MQLGGFRAFKRGPRFSLRALCSLSGALSTSQIVGRSPQSQSPGFDCKSPLGASKSMGLGRTLCILQYDSVLIEWPWM